MKISFTRQEIFDLLKAWILVSLCFTILSFNFNSLPNVSNIFFIFNFKFFFIFFISLFTVGIAFIFHELAHKFLAQKYKSEAIFKADNNMLLLGIFTSFLGFIFISPGGVLIKGNLGIDKRGKISLIGPLTNFFLGLFFLFFYIYFKKLFLFDTFFLYAYKINSFLAFFNMLPFFNFDGKKVFLWNKLSYFVFLIIFFIFWFFSFFISI